MAGAVDIRPRVSGYIDRIAFKEGDMVKAGDGRDPPGEFVPLVHRSGHDLGRIDLGRRRRWGFRLAVAASGDDGGDDHHQRKDPRAAAGASDGGTARAPS